MNLDLRFPIGILFTLLGGLLVGYGAVTEGSPMYERSLGLNVNLGWGGFLLFLGLTMLWMARKGDKL